MSIQEAVGAAGVAGMAFVRCPEMLQAAPNFLENLPPAGRG
jgi:hypothetical protein